MCGGSSKHGCQAPALGPTHISSFALTENMQRRHQGPGRRLRYLNMEMERGAWVLKPHVDSEWFACQAVELLEDMGSSKGGRTLGRVSVHQEICLKGVVGPWILPVPISFCFLALIS